MHVHPDWFLTPQRAAVHVPTKTAVIADVHLGYNESRRNKGDAVPVVSLSSLLAPLEQLANAGVRKIVVAGDLLESPDQVELAYIFLDQMTEFSLDLTGVVPGNHDGDLSRLQDVIPIYADGLKLGKWMILHDEQLAGNDSVVHGHVHPCIRYHGRKAPCFLFGRNRLILPAFSLDAAGVNVKHIPGANLFACYAISQQAIRAIPPLAG